MQGSFRTLRRLVMGPGALTIALVASPQLAPPASAAAAARTHVTLSAAPGGKTFTGRVKSATAHCVGHRTVVLRNHPAFGPKADHDIVIGRATTGPRGKFRIAAHPEPNGGPAWVTVKPAAGCSGAKSASLYFGP